MPSSRDRTRALLPENNCILILIAGPPFTPPLTHHNHSLDTRSPAAIRLIDWFIRLEALSRRFYASGSLMAS